MLYYNHRSCKAIVNFLSNAFYGRKQCLVASRLCYEDRNALTFYCTEGSEVEADGCSYFNVAEIEEIVQVALWFSSFMRQDDICVVSYYTAQVCFH